MGNKMGKPRIFSSPEQMMEKATEYQKICLESNRPFLYIGFASWMGIHRTTVDSYSKFPEYTDTIANIKQLAEVGLIEGGLNGTYNASFSQFLAKNNHGYKDQQNVSMETKIDFESDTLKKIQESIKSK